VTQWSVTDLTLEARVPPTNKTLTVLSSGPFPKQSFASIGLNSHIYGTFFYGMRRHLAIHERYLMHRTLTTLILLIDIINSQSNAWMESLRPHGQRWTTNHQSARDTRQLDGVCVGRCQ